LTWSHGDLVKELKGCESLLQLYFVLAIFNARSLNDCKTRSML